MSVLTISMISNISNLISAYIALTLILFIFIKFAKIQKKVKMTLKVILDIAIPHFLILFISILRLLEGGFFSEPNKIGINFNQIDLFTPSANVLYILIGGGNWIDFITYGPYPYCAYCPQPDEFMQFRIALAIAIVVYSTFIILFLHTYKLAFSILVILILLTYVSSLGLSNNHFVELLLNVEILQLFRSPWTKFAHFASLTMFIMITIAFGKYQQSRIYLNRNLNQHRNLPLLLLITFILLFVILFSSMSFTYITLVLLITIAICFYLSKKFDFFSVILVVYVLFFIFGSISNVNQISKNEAQRIAIMKDYEIINKSYLFVDKLNRLHKENGERICLTFISQNRTSNFYRIAIFNNLHASYKNLSIYDDSTECLTDFYEYKLLVLPSFELNITEIWRLYLGSDWKLIFTDSNYSIYEIRSV
jgi:hypothetical protein